MIIGLQGLQWRDCPACLKSFDGIYCGFFGCRACGYVERADQSSTYEPCARFLPPRRMPDPSLKVLQPHSMPADRLAPVGRLSRLARFRAVA